MFSVGTELQARIATRLLDKPGVAEPAQLGQALSQHLCDRLRDLEEAAEESADFLWRPGEDEGWDIEAILGLVQHDPRDLRHIRTSADARSVNVPVRTEQIKRWRAAAQALAGETDDLTAFAAFADLEDAFEPIEARVIELSMIIDREIQMRKDIERGK